MPLKNCLRLFGVWNPVLRRIVFSSPRYSDRLRFLNLAKSNLVDQDKFEVLRFDVNLDHN